MRCPPRDFSGENLFVPNIGQRQSSSHLGFQLNPRSPLSSALQQRPHLLGETVSTIYGMENQVSFGVIEFEPGTSQAVQPSQTIVPVSVFLTRPPDNTPSFLVSWHSLDHGYHEMIKIKVNQALPAEWDNHILSRHSLENLQINIGLRTASFESTHVSPQLGDLDLAFYNQLVEHFDAFTQNLGTSASLSSSLSVSQGSHGGFWQVLADWDHDTDGDGTPDWIEFKTMPSISLKRLRITVKSLQMKFSEPRLR